MKSITLILSFVLLSLSVSAQENKKDAVVAIPNMNVLYFGIPNPIEIAVPGVTSDKISANVTNGSLNKTNSGWEIKPSTITENVKLTVFVDNQKVSEKMFRVKPIPAPVAIISGKPNGVVSKNDIIKAGVIEVELKGFLWDLKYEVKSYKFAYNENGSTKEISISGNKLTNEIGSVIANLKAGQQIQFTEIKALAPDNRIQNLNPLIFTLN